MYRIVTDKACKQLALSMALLMTVTAAAPCMAAPKTSSDGFMMLTINTACGKQSSTRTPNAVEQLQAVHKLSQSQSPETFQGLIEVLQSSSPIARRKAAKALLDEWPMIAQAGKSQQMAGSWVNQLKPFVKDTDWVVQKTVVRLLTLMNSGASKAAVTSLTVSMSVEDRTFFETGFTAVKPVEPSVQPVVEPTPVIATEPKLPEPPATVTMDGLKKASIELPQLP